MVYPVESTPDNLAPKSPGSERRNRLFGHEIMQKTAIFAAKAGIPTRNRHEATPFDFRIRRRSMAAEERKAEQRSQRGLRMRDKPGDACLSRGRKQHGRRMNIGRNRKRGRAIVQWTCAQ